MKLVAAKCPNCGANLDVNPNDETIKCQYCRSSILVDDAIAKYKLEISGEVEIRNLPKIDNYLKIADRNYQTKEYDEAYKTYAKIIELDPNNTISLLRYGICKTLLNNYIDFSLKYLNNTFIEVINLIKENNEYEKNIESYVDETCNAIDESLYAVRKYYNSYTVNSSDLSQIQTKLMSIVECYETILEHTSIYKTHIVQQLTSVLKDIIKDKSYKTGTDREGGDFLNTYRISFSQKEALTKKLNYYENILNPANSEEEGCNDKNKVKKGSIKINNIGLLQNNIKVNNTIIAIDIFLWLLILGSFISGQIVSSLIMIFIFLIITFEKVSEKLFKKDHKKKKYCIIILVIILFITICYGI